MSRFTFLLYFTPSRSAKYCDERMCSLVSVCPHVCMSAGWRISKTTYPNFTKFAVPALAVACSSSDDNAICYLLPVLLMTSCLPVMDHGY